MAILFSIITPSFNQGRFIRANIESVLAQGRADVEHIIVDGGSTDETVQILKEYPHLRWVSENDRGQSDALNKGIALARGEWIVWINSDDYLLPDSLDRFARFVEAHPAARFVYSNMVFVDENGVELSRRKATYTRDNKTLYYWWRRGVGFSQPGSFFRKSLWEEYGPFDAALHYTMDYDFWLKISEDVVFLYLDACLAAYRLHGASKTLEGWRPFLLEKIGVAGRYWDARGGWRKWEFRFLLPLAFSKKAVLEGLLRWDAGDRDKARALWEEALRSQPLGFLLAPVLVLCAAKDLEKAVLGLSTEAHGGGEMMESTQPVSVVIPAYNSAAFIERAIRSALEQTWRPLEIIVIDDGSTDQTEEAVQSILSAQATRPAKSTPSTESIQSIDQHGQNQEALVRYIRQENAGAAAARNCGIEEAKGDFVAFLDSDDEWLPQRLEKTLSPLLANPDIALCYCHSLDVLPDGAKTLHGAESVKHRFPGGIYPPPYIHTSAATFRRACFERCGMFDTTMSKCEDPDFFVRVAENYPVHEVPEPLAIVHLRPGSLSRVSDAEGGARMHFRYVLKALGRAQAPRNVDAVLSAAYFSAGIYHLNAWLNGPARRYFLVSFLLRPSWRSFQFVLRTFVPRSLVTLARQRRAKRLRRRGEKVLTDT